MPGSIFIEEHHLVSHNVKFNLAKVVGEYKSWRQVTSSTGSNPLVGTTDQPIEHYLGEGDLVSNCSSRTVAYGFENAQIFNGVVYSDFQSPNSVNGKLGRGVQTLGVKADGSAEIYSVFDGDSAAAMAAAGVKWTFGFAGAAVRDGVAQDQEGSGLFNGFLAPSARIVVGVDDKNQPMLLTVEGKTGIGGLGMNDTALLCKELGFIQASHMDGGGSVQAAYRGSVYHASSDSGRRRTLHAAMAISV